MSIFDEARRRAAEQQGRQRGQISQARRALGGPRITQGPTSSPMRLPGSPQQTAGRPQGVRGLRTMGEETQALMETKGQKIREAAKKKSAVQRAGAEKGLAAHVGRSARQSGSGGRGEMLASVGSDLSREAAATEAGAELDVLQADLDAKEFEAEKQVTPGEARELVEAYIDSIEDSYSGVFGDDETGLASDIERWANEMDEDGRTYLRSDNERKYALEQVRRLRAYDKNFWGPLSRSTGGRHIGWK